ncbi:Gfo/Idh/MocA family protein [Litoribacter populi]|uniref:Gfo/Idh/MocA family protein n=1 Tax=Litoribacter populi TaxID=2598460 RepID=UPI001180536A|nr:Gfo/Idh/MocA family oxidoreductase [Litoribacter populi]
MKYQLFFTFLMLLNTQFSFSQSANPVRMAVAGLAHGHSHWIFNDLGEETVLTGIYEPNESLKNQFKDQYNLDDSLFHNSLEELLQNTNAEGVLAFGPISDHLEVVKAAAPRGIHVMVEKPLALDIEQAKEMADLAVKHNIHVLTNYETSWYPSTQETANRLEKHKDQFGPIRKSVFHHGHKGPIEIGVGKEFLDWLTDPKQSGGGALMDFGCYGANIMTMLMNGERPESVTAVTQSFKPDIYKEVEDEATIILTYPSSQAIIQASWNWPIDRKDMEIYAEKGQIITPNRDEMIIRKGSKKESIKLKEENENPFTFFAKVIREDRSIQPFSLYSLENNLIVMEILTAARESAANGKTIQMK